MSLERKKILDLLASGKISPEEADRLLGRLDASSGRGPGPSSHAGDGAATSAHAVSVVASPQGTRRRLRFLRILVTGSRGDVVNVRVPLDLVRAGVKLTAALPQEAKDKLAARGVDLDHLCGLDGESLIDALRELSIDVDSDDGDTVRIFCE